MQRHKIKLLLLMQGPFQIDAIYHNLLSNFDHLAFAQGPAQRLDAKASRP